MRTLFAIRRVQESLPQRLDLTPDLECLAANPYAGRIQIPLLVAVCTHVLEGEESVDASAPPPEYCSVRQNCP